MHLFGQDKIDSFIASHHLGVLATADQSGRPSSSTIVYVLESKHIVFISKDQTHKAKNLAVNPFVSLTILDSEKPIAVNVHGKVTRVDDDTRRDEILHAVMTAAQKHQKDFAPIIKLHKGAFIAYELSMYDAVYADYTKPLGLVEEEQKNYS